MKKKRVKRVARDKNAALFWEAGRLWMGSAEVIMRRMGMMGQAFGGGPLPYAEISRMWHEKFAAGITLSMNLGMAPLAAMPALFKNRNSTNMAAVLLEEQVNIVAKALKPVSRAVRANKKRISKKR